MLTAAHVVTESGRSVPWVQVRTGAGLVEAQVAWHHHRDGVDVALVVITDEGWSPPSWRHPVRWGRLVTTRTGQVCRATGFPRVVATPQLRDSHEAVGLLNPGSLAKSGLYAVEVTNPPAPSEPGGSAWAGMSGAALLCPDLRQSDLLVGVVTADPAGFDSRRLVVVPITTVAADPGLVAIVAEHTGAAPVVEPVELAGLSTQVEPAWSPAGLLRADAADTPFRARPELGRLAQWCRDPAWSGIRLVTGPGGQGKTRLARQLATEMAAEGWSTVVLTETATPEEIEILAQVTEPTLVVVDYAEGRTHQLAALLSAMERTEAKVRLLLLARTAGAWRTDRVDPDPRLEVLARDDIVVELGPVEPTADGRREAWTQAVAAFAPRLGRLEGYRDTDWPAVAAALEPPPLDGDRFRTILAVQVDALAALLQASDPINLMVDGEAAEVLLAHENRYWSRVADRFGITLSPATRRCLVAAATLWGAASVAEAHRVVAALLPDLGRDQVINIADWLATLYRDNERHWSGLQPDPVAEHLIGSTLTPQGLSATLVTDTVAAASPAQLAHGLTILGRAHPHHPHLTDSIAEIVESGPEAAIAAIAVAPRLAAPRPLLDALSRLAATADLSTLRRLNNALPDSSVLLAQTSLDVAAALVAQLRQAANVDRDTHLPDLALALNNLCIRLRQVGRNTDALSVAQETVDLHRQLAARDREAHLLSLAIAINSLADQFRVAACPVEALAAGQEAVAFPREVVARYGEAYLPYLAMSVSNLASWLTEVGRYGDALEAARVSVDLRRELVSRSGDAHLSDLALSLRNLAHCLSRVGRRVEALEAAQEAVDLCREVASGDNGFFPDLARSTSVLASYLCDVGRHAEALEVAQEAVELCRQLVELNRDAHLPRLAGSVGALAGLLGEMARFTEAVLPAQEAVDLCRQLVEQNRDAHLPRLAMSLNNLSVWLRQAGRALEAYAAASEAVELYRELASLDQNAHLSDLAMSINNIAADLGDMGRFAEAVAAAEESVCIYRRVASLDRDAHLPGFAISTANLAAQLSEAGRRVEARPFAWEAVALFEELTRVYPGEFDDELRQAVQLARELEED